MILKKKLCIFKLNEYNFGLYPDLGGKKILKESGSTSIWVKLLNLGMVKKKKLMKIKCANLSFECLITELCKVIFKNVKKDTVQFVQLVQLDKQLK
ncbi:unnamed protein product [Rhizophagus irregularis]|nr:unnamed protein product [Rhizophagus irregularis]